jgi:RNA polymerase sigma factor (TIGR02999 family)
LDYFGDAPYCLRGTGAIRCHDFHPGKPAWNGCEPQFFFTGHKAFIYDKFDNMPFETPHEVTQVLQALARGDGRASEELLPLVYDELRRLAAMRMSQESVGQTLQATALVHEAWLRMIGDGDRTWQNRAHFFGAAAEAMRRILVENARRKSRLKRGGGRLRLDIDEMDLASTPPDEKILLMNDALEQLQAEDAEKARIVVLKFFGGLTNQEVAENLRVTERTVERQWAYARAWLLRRIHAQI